MAGHTGVFNWLKSKVVNGFISSKSFISYYSSDSSIYPQSALPDDNSLVTRGMLNIVADSIPSTGGQVTQLITGGTTPMPTDIPYTSFINPTVMFKNEDGSDYAGAFAQDNAYAGTPVNSITVTGNADGTHFIDTFWVIIKP